MGAQKFNFAPKFPEMGDFRPIFRMFARQYSGMFSHRNVGVQVLIVA